jgi:hypothetical protein
MTPVILISFDIDGTLEMGDPPGPIPLALVRLAREKGYVVGSASDRTLLDQRRLWDHHGIVVDFVSNKHRLHEVRSQFQFSRGIHIGDAIMDEISAHHAGFDFWYADAIPSAGDENWVF